MDIIAVINTLGFPIACVVACGWFIFKIGKRTYIEEMLKKLEVKPYLKAIGNEGEKEERIFLKIGRLTPIEIRLKQLGLM